jgi:CubicO group peptidase (beta-lactamase class C family)
MTMPISVLRPLLLLCVLMPGTLAAQAADTTTRPIVVGDVVADSLPAGATHVFTVTFDADRFVYGEVDQRTVDVRITVRDPAGAVVRRFNGAPRGAERVHFDAASAGEYRIELDMPGDSAGSYALNLLRVEPIASEPGARVDQLMIAYSGDVPGGVVGVVRDGRLVFARGYGMASLEYDVPFTTETPTNIGSTSKQFTAFAIMLLKEQGELSLDDDIRKYVPELPDFGQTVTLRHLMTHTSGYREFVNTIALTGRQLLEGDYIDRSEIIKVVQRQPKLQNDPGAEFNYNNTAFGLLSMVVERTTDTPFAEWMRENVFLPLGMQNTVVRATPTQIVDRRAQGYSPAPAGGFRATPDLGASMGAGGIYTTVGDLARWIDNLETGRLGGKGVIEAMTTRNILTSGDTTDYGFGLFIDEFRGLRRVHHGGSDIAHRSTFLVFPDQRAGVVVLSNNASFTGAIPTAIVETFLADALEPEEAGEAGEQVAGPFDPASWDPASFDELAGRYAMDQMPAVMMTFTREGDSIFGQVTGQPRIPLEPTSDTTFTLVGVPASVTFHRDDEGAVTHLIMHQNGEHRATRMEGAEWSPGVAELEAYVGRYFSEELETFYTLAIDEDKLVIRHRRFDDVVLSAGSKPDSFSGGFPVANASFERDGDGQVTTLVVGNVRAREIRFERVR